MRRRDFIKVMAGSAAAWPLAARAQHSDRRRLGLLTNLGDAEIKGRIGPFLEELQRLGWTDGHNIQIDKRNGAANVDALRKQAAWSRLGLASSSQLAPSPQLTYFRRPALCQLFSCSLLTRSVVASSTTSRGRAETLRVL